MKKILVINSGSSSIKYQLFTMPSKEVLAKGMVERIGISGGIIKHAWRKSKQEKWNECILNVEIPTHRLGIEKVNELLSDPRKGLIGNSSEIDILGHRVVHGGSSFTQPTLITAEVKEGIRAISLLAPLHCPANLVGIEVSEEIFPKASQVAVFDTAFHSTLAQKAYRYAISDELYEKHHVRVYGFHGISHSYVSKQATEHLKNPKAKLISLHLGNGASMAAIKEGISIDTSMGFGPNNGLIMGTRSGDLDSAIVFYALKLGYSPEQLSDLFNKNSGMLALCGYSDMRDIGKAYKEGDEKARLAYEMYTYRIKKYIGSYVSVMNGCDGLIFTGGVGENDALSRELICSEMDFLGISLDKEKNTFSSCELREIQAKDSKVKVLIIPTDEEGQIAEESFALASK